MSEKISANTVSETICDPICVGAAPANEATAVRLPDGELRLLFTMPDEHVGSIRSADGGRTWGPPEVEFPFGDLRTARACRTLLDAAGELHVFFQVHAGDRNQPPGQRLLNVYHNRTTGSRVQWGTPKLVYEGYVGALRGAAQMPSGRIVVPFAAWRRDAPGCPSFPESAGNNYTTSIYSDDGGATFHCSPSVITAPAPANYNGNRDGACEPCVTVRNDGRAWLLIRTQTGFLYESFSDDGIHWTEGAPTCFYSSNSPAGALRLDDGRLLVVWNNAQMPPRQSDNHMLYGGRDTLHAAISDDDGATWHGFREIYLDPYRHEDPPAKGDRGTAYPNLVQADEGHVVIVTGQNPTRRAILLLHPDWLMQTHRSDDFSEGMRNWCAFKEHGAFYHVFLPRICGPTLTDDSESSSGRAMQVRRPDDRAPDCAVWNFPAGRSGTVALRLKRRAGAAGLKVSLQDRFYNPNDLSAEAEAMCVVTIGPDGRIGDTAIGDEQWHTITIDFDTSADAAALRVDGYDAAHAAMQAGAPHGVSYLRIRSTAETVDPVGWLVGRVEAHVR